MNQSTIDDSIRSLKRIIRDNKAIFVPNTREQENVELKSSNDSFVVYIGRKGHKKVRFSINFFSLRERDTPVIRLDLIGKIHTNLEGDFPYAGESIPTPYIHIAKEGYGDSIAFPLGAEEALIHLSEEEKKDFVKVVERFFTAINTANISDFDIKMQGELFD